MPACAMSGCSSNSKTTDYTLYKIPRSLLRRVRWLEAIGRPLDSTERLYVCSCHFEKSAFVGVERNKLGRNAVPTLFITPPVKPGAGADLLACRICLDVDVELYAIRDTKFESTYAKITGTPLSKEDGLPRRLCAWCCEQLSKCAEFRDRCQRSHSLLQTLLEWGPLTMDDIKAIDRRSHKLTNNATPSKVCDEPNHPFIQITQIKTEKDENSLRGAGTSNHIEVEYVENDDCLENDSDGNYDDRKKAKIENVKLETGDSKKSLETEHFIEVELKSVVDEDRGSLEEKIELENKSKKVKLENEISENCIETKACIELEHVSDANEIDADSLSEKVVIRKERKKGKLESGISENDSITRDCLENKMKSDSKEKDSDSPKEKVAIRKKSKAKLEKNKLNISSKLKNRNPECHFSCKRRKIGDDYYPDFDYEAFEKEFNVKIKLLSSEKQKQEIEDRKRANKGKLCCEMCGKVYIHENTMKAHLLHHDPSSGRYECNICHYRFRFNFSLLKHQDGHRLSFTCETCGCVTRLRTSAKNHFLMHQGKTYSCPHCEEVYNLKGSYFNHLRLVHPGHSVACDQCGQSFLSALGVRRHKEREHKLNVKPKAEFKCSDCDVAFLSSQALDKHRAASRGVPHAALCACAACGDSCGSDAARAQHQAERHPPDHCCQERSQPWASLSRPASRELPRRRLGPRPCGPQPGVCEVCGRVFKNEGLLRFHLVTHMQQKPYACPKCPKTFATQQSQECHMRVHTGERPYQCEQCPLAFSLQGNLARHCKVVHLNQRKSFPCQLCHKAFTTRSGEQLHVRTVHNNMPWPKRARKGNKPAITDK